MGITTRFQHWNHTHQSFLLLVVRIVLGLILLAKGIFFISHAQSLSRFAAGVGFLTGYITFAHLFGGVFIIIGLFTRFATALQIPVLLGALFFILPRQDIDFSTSGFFLSIVVLGLLVLVLIKGGGLIAMDAYLRDHLL